MNQLLIFAHLANLLFLSSCNKQELLLAERTKLEAELKQGHDELRELDSKFASLGQDSVTASITIQRQNAEWLRKNTSLEAELAFISGKCSEGEAALKQLRPRLDSYKAKFVR
jgi:predicted RNase H-like nuclease (RuvC/YqgF family)